MSAAFLPAVATGALLAFVAQTPPSLEPAQRWLPVVLRTGVPDVFGSLSHRAPRHEATCALQHSAPLAAAPSPRPAPRRAVPPGAAAPPPANRVLLTRFQTHRGPRRPWPPRGSGAQAHAPQALRPWWAGPAQAGGLPPAPPRRAACRRRPQRGPLSTEQRQFVVRHLALAQQQARRFAVLHGLEYDDLLGPAYEGLCKAALGFEPRRGHRPSSYVVPKVKGELLHHLRDMGFAMRISHRLRELWLRARAPLAAGLADAQIASALQVPLELWLECREVCGQPPLPLHEIRGL